MDGAIRASRRAAGEALAALVQEMNEDRRILTPRNVGGGPRSLLRRCDFQVLARFRIH